MMEYEPASDLLGLEPSGFALDFLSNTYAVRTTANTPHNPDWQPINDSQTPNWEELAA